jgi:hypothetical protein
MQIYKYLNKLITTLLIKKIRKESAYLQVAMLGV